MKRVEISERPDWREKANEYGFDFHTMYDQPYWCEDAYYQFSSAQIEELEDTSVELHERCLDVVEKVIHSDKLLTKFSISQHCWSFLRASWHPRQPCLYSRLDLVYDGKHPAKLLENNADTPTSLYETAFFQWMWLEDQVKAGHLPVNADQYNSLQDKLIERFIELRKKAGFRSLHLTCCQDSAEDRATVKYLEDCAQEAGLSTKFLFINEIGIDEEKGQFIDLDDKVICNFFKLYPWEYMFRDEFSTNLGNAGARWLEPAWKSIISNKALLPLLWEMFPGHPNLLPAYFADDDHPPMDSYVIKPLFSREGANIQIIENGKQVLKVDGPYGKEGMIVQQFHSLPEFGKNHTLIGSWLVNDEPCGIGLREDKSLITQDLSRFYPHIILD